MVESYWVIEHRIVSPGLDELGGSALTNKNLAVPECGTQDLPVAKVPAISIVFLSHALVWAAIIGASAICIGVNPLDYSGYTDCRPAYINAVQSMMDLVTKKAAEGSVIVLHAPLVEKSKAEIIKTGMEQRVDFGLIVSCYQADEGGNACGLCDSCRPRKQGFADAQLCDPTWHR